MKISGSYNPYSINNNMGTTSKKPTNAKDYSNYLTQKFGCLTPGKSASVSVTGGLLRKAMSDEKTGEWLERELSKAPDYIKAAQKSAIAHGTTLKSVSIEFGEEYSTMTTFVVSNGGGTDSEIDKWLEKIKEKKAEQKEAEKKLEQKQQKQKTEEASFNMEFRGKNLEDLANQFTMKLAGTMTLLSGGAFDIRG